MLDNTFPVIFKKLHFKKKIFKKGYLGEAVVPWSRKRISFNQQPQKQEVAEVFATVSTYFV